MTDFMEFALRTIPAPHASAISGALVSGAGVVGLVGARVFGVVTSNVDPTFWAMIAVGVAAAAGNAWVEFQWRKRRREVELGEYEKQKGIDLAIYEKQRRIDLAIYEKQREKDTGFEIDILSPDPDK